MNSFWKIDQLPDRMLSSPCQESLSKGPFQMDAKLVGLRMVQSSLARVMELRM